MIRKGGELLQVVGPYAANAAWCYDQHPVNFVHLVKCAHSRNSGKRFAAAHFK